MFFSIAKVSKFFFNSSIKSNNNFVFILFLYFLYTIKKSLRILIYNMAHFNFFSFNFFSFFLALLYKFLDKGCCAQTFEYFSIFLLHFLDFILFFFFIFFIDFYTLKQRFLNYFFILHLIFN